jgi:hypothetical protein
MLCYATAPRGGRPLAWAVLLAVFPQLAPGEVADFAFKFNLTIGCGASTIPFPQLFNLLHPAFPPITALLTIPASNIMISATMTAPIGTLAGNTFQVAAMAAPITDAAQLADALESASNARQPGDDMHGRPFTEEEMAYHHNR